MRALVSGPVPVVLANVATVVHATGFTAKSPVITTESLAATSLPIPAGNVMVIVHVSSAVPAANARLATSGVGSVKVGF